MKTKTLLFALIIIALPLVCFAQSVKITPQKITYKRPKPIADFKKTFTVNYPKVKAATPALSRKIENTISFSKVLGLNVQEEKGEYQWLEEADYEVGYNKNGILSIYLWMTGTAAYPSTNDKHIVVNLKTGNQIKPEEIFTNLAGLAAEAKKRQQEEMKKAKEEYKKDVDSADFDGSPYFDDADFTVENLNEFSVSEKGVTFYYDYGFPRVILALQPDGEYFFSWSELKPYIKRGGLLEQFNR